MKTIKRTGKNVKLSGYMFQDLNRHAAGTTNLKILFFHYRTAMIKFKILKLIIAGVLFFSFLPKKADCRVLLRSKNCSCPHPAQNMLFYDSKNIGLLSLASKTY